MKMNKRCFLTVFILGILVFCGFAVPQTEGNNGGSEKKNVKECRHLAIQHLDSVLNLETFGRDKSVLVEARRDIQCVPIYLKPYIGKFVIEHMDKMKNQNIRKYKHTPGTHNLNITAGRAAWFAEALFNLELPYKVTSDTTEQEVKQLREVARNHFKAMKGNLSKEEQKANEKQSKENRIEQLQKSYGPKIEPNNRKKYSQSVEAIKRLLKDWVPIGKNIEDLEQIIGEEPLKKGESHYVYQFDSGYTAVAFHFKTDKKHKIEYVYIVSGG